MSSMIIWMLGVGVSIAGLVLTASMQLHYVHMAIAALVSIMVALASFQEARHANATNGPRIAAQQYRYVGLVWTWGAVALFAIYGFGILSWREWWLFFLAFVLLAGLALFVSSTLERDASGEADPVMENVARVIAIVLLIAMIVTMVGLIVDGKMWRFNTAAGQRVGWQDWGANNVFFFGAMAIAAICPSIIRALRPRT